MARYYVTVTNGYLSKQRRVSGSTRREALSRAQLQSEQWLRKRCVLATERQYRTPSRKPWR
jgi:hypothetical protein